MHLFPFFARACSVVVPVYTGRLQSDPATLPLHALSIGQIINLHQLKKERTSRLGHGRFSHNTNIGEMAGQVPCSVCCWSGVFVFASHLHQALSWTRYEQTGSIEYKKGSIVAYCRKPVLCQSNSLLPPFSAPKLHTFATFASIFNISK